MAYILSILQSVGADLHKVQVLQGCLKTCKVEDVGAHVKSWVSEIQGHKYKVDAIRAVVDAKLNWRISPIETVELCAFGSDCHSFAALQLLVPLWSGTEVIVPSGLGKFLALFQSDKYKADCVFLLRPWVVRMLSTELDNDINHVIVQHVAGGHYRATLIQALSQCRIVPEHYGKASDEKRSDMKESTPSPSPPGGASMSENSEAVGERQSGKKQPQAGCIIC